MTEVCPVTYTANLSNDWTTADYPLRLLVSHVWHEGVPPFFPRGMVECTVCTEAYISDVLCIPSSRASMDLGTDYGVYFFVFKEWHHRDRN